MIATTHRQFGISAKKLQRLLAQEQTSFSEILDEVRRSTACRFLEETAIPIQNIAGWLEYSGAPAFIMGVQALGGYDAERVSRAARSGCHRTH